VNEVFVNPAGQRDNLGDSVLRRPYLEALRALGRLHVLVGADPDYASGLGLVESDVLYTSRGVWLRKATIAALRSRAHFAVNAGEVVGTRREAVRSIWQVMLATIVRMRGGRVVLAGVSVRPGTLTTATHLRRLARISSVATWRDAPTCQSVGTGRVTPDWAFGLTSEVSAPPLAGREYVAVTLRGDRPPPDPTWLANVRQFAATRNVKIVVVVQVRRDHGRAIELAEALGAEVRAWPAGSSHRDQEELVRSTYRQCVAVVSDRIHALIIGFTEGAVPIGTSTSSPEKIFRTFAAVTEAPVAPKKGLPDLERWNLLAESGEALSDDLSTARSRLADLSSEVAGLARDYRLAEVSQ
jgi:polysaccharide pyruvyl transferase WcaK-like protein